MSKRAERYRHTSMSKRELLEELDFQESAREIDAWAEYLIETGRIYQ